MCSWHKKCGLLFFFFFRLSQKIYHISRGTMGTQMPREPLKNSVWIIWILYIFKAKWIKFMQEEWPSFKLWVLGLKSTGSNLFWYIAPHPSLSLNVMVHVCLSKSLSLSLFLSIWCVLFYFLFLYFFWVVWSWKSNSIQSVQSYFVMFHSLPHFLYSRQDYG